MRVHHGERSIERHCRVKEVLKHVGIVYEVRVGVVRTLARGERKVETRHMLRDAVDDYGNQYRVTMIQALLFNASK